MVYNFTLPPLTLYTFHKQDATLLSEWAASLSTPSEQTTFFNFMASHDGIGVRPLEGVLRREEIDALVERTLRHGGLVSYRAAPDGSQVPYELNIVYFDALNDPNADEPLALQVDRFLASQAILLGLAGVPGIYVHSLFGSRNWREGVTLTGQNRTINRRKFRRNELETLLNDPTSLPHQVFTRYHRLIATRTGEPTFHPNAPQQIVHIDPAIFAFVRTRLDSSRRVLCLHNVADHEIQIRIDVSALGLRPGKRLVDLISGRELSLYGAQLEMSLPPYGVYWLGDEIGMA
jgi:sucrose phosphorylase